MYDSVHERPTNHLVSPPHRQTLIPDSEGTKDDRMSWTSLQSNILQQGRAWRCWVLAATMIHEFARITSVDPWQFCLQAFIRGLTKVHMFVQRAHVNESCDEGYAC